jgi:ferredoxin-type protein NapH
MLRQAIMKIGRSGMRIPVQIFSLILLNCQVWQSRADATDITSAINPGKNICLPVLNCHSCPVATTACPIGTVTAFSQKRSFPFYVIGLLGIICISLGRAMCGWACPFGFIQDLLHRIRTPKVGIPRFTLSIKYIILIGLVIVLPFILGDNSKMSAAERIKTGTGTYDFCSTICPVGTLEAGIPGILEGDDGAPEPTQAPTHWRLYVKLSILATILICVIFIQRGFCRVICPLGALTILLSRFSAIKLKTNTTTCIRCDRCVTICPTAARRVPLSHKEIECTAECIMCMDCVHTCPVSNALSTRWFGKQVATSKTKTRRKAKAHGA